MINTKLQPQPAKAFASIALMPSNIRFANQNLDESVVLFIRQHKIILFGYFLKFLFNIFIPIFLFLIFQWLMTFEAVSRQPLNINVAYVWAAVIFWYLWSFTGFFADFLYWFYNGYIITSHRLIDLDFNSVLKHSIKELDLKNIEDAVDTHDGVLQTVFDMGSIVVRTASETTSFSLNNVPKSSKVRDFIMDMAIYNSGQR